MEASRSAVALGSGYGSGYGSGCGVVLVVVVVVVVVVVEVMLVVEVVVAIVVQTVILFCWSRRQMMIMTEGPAAFLVAGGAAGRASTPGVRARKGLVTIIHFSITCRELFPDG